MLHKILLLAGIGIALAFSAKGAPEFHQVKALPGDGVYSLLRRFELDRHSCNFQQFYALNELKKGAPLIAGRQYKVPILLYTFNGRSIRSTIGIDDWDVALGIQHYNERMLGAQLRESPFQKDKVLWVPYHALNCPEELVGGAVATGAADTGPASEGEPASGRDRYYPIFGNKLAYTPLESNKLKGQVFYIDPGHGGPDPGAMAKRGGRNLCEDEYAYDVSLRLCRNLIAHGATAYMIVRDENDGIRPGVYLDCDYDEVLWGEVKMVRALRPRLFQRSEKVNELYEKHKKQGVKIQKLITIHVDSRNRGEQVDLFFYYKPGNEASRQLAIQLHQTMKAKYRRYRSSGSYHGTVTARDLHMLRETLPTSVYIELGNIRNEFDQKRVVVESNRQALANWLFDGLVK